MGGDGLHIVCRGSGRCEAEGCVGVSIAVVGGSRGCVSVAVVGGSRGCVAGCVSIAVVGRHLLHGSVDILWLRGSLLPQSLFVLPEPETNSLYRNIHLHIHKV